MIEARTDAEATSSNWTLPASAYSDPDVLRQELRAVFGRSWHYVARSDAVSRPGDQVAGVVGDLPVAVVRDEHGALRGFANVCRHRLHPVVTERCNRQTLQCRYHGWTYGLDGSLVGVPRDGPQPLERASLGLIPVAVAEWCGMVFASRDPDTEDLSDALGSLAGDPRIASLDVASYRPAGETVYEHACNWKLSVENALECYHCPTVHRESFSRAFDTDLEGYRVTDYPQGSVHSADVGRMAPHANQERRLGFLFVYVWPATFISIDGFLGSAVTVHPLDVGRSRFVAEWWAHRDATEEQIADWTDIWDRTFREDLAVVGAQQPGYASGVVERGRLLPSSESSIQNFLDRTRLALRGTA
jgi:phenylpropionate dioxygenase-like ring-hydroxylating dioxygenase large terminal subunit